MTWVKLRHCPASLTTQTPPGSLHRTVLLIQQLPEDVLRAALIDVSQARVERCANDHPECDAVELDWLLEPLISISS